MSPLRSLLLFQLGLVAFAQKGQIIILQPSSIPQCAITPIIWTGGTPPFTMSTAPTDDSAIDAFEFEQAIETHQSTFDENWPAGTKFTITITDNNGNSQTTNPPLVVGPSSNSSCLDASDDSVNDTSSSSTQQSQSTNSQTRAQSQTVSSSSHSALPTQSAGSKEPITKDLVRRPGHVVIIGAVVAVVAVVLLVAGLIIFLRRRNRRNKLSGRDKFARTFGNNKGGLDDDEEGRIPSMAIPEPFVYLSTPNSNLDRQGTKTSRKGVRRSPTNTGRASGTTTHITPQSPSSASTSETPRSPSTNASRKGERYLPNFLVSQPQPDSASSNSRIPDEDIDRLAARMVELMSAGRMSDQSWSPAAKRAQEADLDLDDDEGLPGYNEVTRGRGPPPAGPSS